MGTFPCAAELLNDSNIITRLAKQGEGASRYGERLALARKAMETKAEIGAIIEKGHPELKRRGIEFPTDEKYALMGWWILSDIWVDWQSEDGKDVQLLMGRFEVVDEKGVWWGSQTETSDDDETPKQSEASETTTCASCSQEMNARYEGKVFCGRPDCSSSANAASTAHLPHPRVYRQHYIQKRASMEGRTRNPYPYLPAEPVQLTKDELVNLLAVKKPEKNTDKTFFSDRPMWQSYLCRRCKVSNQRTTWAELVCRKCKNVLPVKLPDIAFEDVVHKDFRDLDIDTDIDKYIKFNDSAVKRSPRTITERAIVETFELHDNNRILVLFPNKMIDGTLRDLYERAYALYQSGDLELLRGLTQSFQTGQRTAWFGVNFGVQYNMRVGVLNHKMDDCPRVIKEIIELMTEMIEEALGKRPDFNEVLSIGNYPNQHMNYYSDGEKNVVGDVVASLSLGSLANMSFALNNEYYTGRVTKNNYPPSDPIVAGTLEETEKRALHKKLKDGEVIKDEFQEEWDAIIKPLKHGQSKKMQLKVPLPFGTTLVQYGSSMQKLYAHEVELASGGFMRMVSTGRTLAEPEAAVVTDDRSHDQEGENEDGSEVEEGQQPKGKRKAAGKLSKHANKKARKH